MKNQKLVQEFIDCVKKDKFDYSKCDQQTLLLLRNQAAEQGIELTPNETKELIDLIAYVQK